MKIVAMISAALMTLTASAQEGKIDAVFNKFKDSNSFKIEFSNGYNRFVLTSKGETFKVENTRTDIIYDGEVLYSINKKSSEIIIEELEGDGVLANPINMFTLNTSDFTIKEVGDLYLLTPIDRDKVGVETITLTLNDKREISKLSFIPISGEGVEFTVNNISYNLADIANFKFSKKEYPGFEVIDFR